jgi:hypothetical protein
MLPQTAFRCFLKLHSDACSHRIPMLFHTTFRCLRPTRRHPLPAIMQSRGSPLAALFAMWATACVRENGCCLLSWIGKTTCGRRLYERYIRGSSATQQRYSVHRGTRCWSYHWSLVFITTRPGRYLGVLGTVYPRPHSAPCSSLQNILSRLNPSGLVSHLDIPPISTDLNRHSPRRRHPRRAERMPCSAYTPPISLSRRTACVWALVTPFSK